MLVLLKVFLHAIIIILFGNEAALSNYHRFEHRSKRSIPDPFYPEELNPNYWRDQARKTILNKLHIEQNKNVAKNIILFLGDGMSFPTLAAARVYLGQQNQKPGEETELFFEKFPYTALSKTYCVDKQVADSACSATAYLCGVKANEGTIGVSAAVPLGDCNKSRNNSTHVTSIARWSQLKKKMTGVVTTTRITHASPTGVFGNIAHRDWESDKDLKDANITFEDCSDIAYQLIHSETGKELNVILGGGRIKFLPKIQKGERLDGKNLITEWLNMKKSENLAAQYVEKVDDLLKVPDNIDYLLGLFADSHINYNLDKTEDEPSLSQMTESAIKILSKGKNGFFLFVEGGRIDHGHHDNKPKKALDETVEFAKAVETAFNLTNSKDTLIVVTADHSHAMTLNGYANRGNSIFQFGGSGVDKLPYATLSYANGPGYKIEVNGSRHDLRKDENTMNGKDYVFPAMAPLTSETHGGDDVGIFATGPWAHLFGGVIQQNVIPHILAYASCVAQDNGPIADICSDSSNLIHPNIMLLIVTFMICNKVFSH